MGKKKGKLSTDGGRSLEGDNPFQSLDAGRFAEGNASRGGAVRRPQSAANSGRGQSGSPRKRGRVDVARKRAAGGGGWMTSISGFKGISAEEKSDLKKRIQKRCGVGGSVKAGAIEIQGDKREEVRSVLEEAGFRVVFAGG